MIQRRRPEADPIPAFRAILEDYEAKCLKEKEKTGNSRGSHGGISGEDPQKKKRVGPAVGPPTQALDDDGKQSNDKRRRIVGPSIGPSPPPLAVGPSSDTTSSKSNKKAMGPASVPPRSTDIGPSLPSAKEIGPSMPPPAAEEEPPVKAGPSATIGPSLPPSSS